MAHLAREHPAHRELFAAATMLAGAMMMLRVLVIVAAINIALLPTLSLPLILGALTQALTGSAIAMRAGNEGESSEPLTLKNPLDLAAVLQFGALLAVIMALAKGICGVGGLGRRLRTCCDLGHGGCRCHKPVDGAPRTRPS